MPRVAFLPEEGRGTNTESRFHFEIQMINVSVLVYSSLEHRDIYRKLKIGLVFLFIHCFYPLPIITSIKQNTPKLKIFTNAEIITEEEKTHKIILSSTGGWGKGAGAPIARACGNRRMAEGQA